MSYPTTPRELADALQSVVDDLRALPDTELPETSVSVYIQPHVNSGTPMSRMRAVDLLGWALTGATGEMTEDGEAYRVPYAAQAGVAVFTDPRPGLCPHDHSHTREWCGYPDCRES